MNYDLLASSSSKSSQSSDPARCTFRKSHGHRCNMLALSGTPFCFSHQPKPEPEPIIAPELAEAAGTLASPEDVHRALAKIFHLLADDRISLKKAGVFCFLAQNILRAQREIAFRQKLREERAEQEADKHLSAHPFRYWHLPRPDRD